MELNSILSKDTEALASGSLLEELEVIINNQKDIDPEFVEVINKKFWDILA